MAFKAVIFDLDGTLVDSEPVWQQVLETIVQRFGKTFDPAFHASLLGTERGETLRRVIERFDLPASVDELAPLYD
ncbi:MAG: HAD hydrolase-like protein, partial [Patescibacteria group bacterium]